MKSKLTKFYTTYDVLLNQNNRTYCGILQDLNSQELALNYQCVSTVFSVTAGAGATLSLNESERRLKEMASEDLCHYNTYVKKYEMEYETDAGQVHQKISLQDCYLILFMDNLVRLKTRSDPMPNESRTKQICTLPITLKGIPRDSSIVLAWHSENCSGEPLCTCKKDVLMTKEDFEMKLTTLSPHEDTMA